MFMLFILIEVIMKYYLVINISSPPELFKDLSEKVHVKKDDFSRRILDQ